MPKAIPLERRCLPLHEWPLADQAAWRCAVDPGDTLESAGGAAGWTPKSRRTVIAAYGRWLSFLDLRGQLDPTCQAKVASGAAEPPAAPPEDITLLHEIRDSLNK